jgi:hypothetical protein
MATHIFILLEYQSHVWASRIELYFRQHYLKISALCLVSQTCTTILIKIQMYVVLTDVCLSCRHCSSLYDCDPNKALDHTGLLCLGSPHIIAIPKSLCRTPYPQTWRRLSSLTHCHPIVSIGNALPFVR